MKFRPGGFFDLLFNIELKKVGVKIFREISYFSSPIIKDARWESFVGFVAFDVFFHSRI